MDPFLERMIARANVRFKRGDKQDHQTPAMGEEINQRRLIKEDVSSQINYRQLNIEPFPSKELIPIRSPRKFVPNEATFKTTWESEVSSMTSEKVMTKESPAFVKAIGSSPKVAGDNKMASLHRTLKLCAASGTGQDFIPAAISTPILGGRCLAKKNQISSTNNAIGNEEFKKTYPCLNECNNTTPSKNNTKAVNYRNAFQEMNNNFASCLSTNLKEEQSKLATHACIKDKPLASHRLMIDRNDLLEEEDTSMFMNDITPKMQQPNSLLDVRDNKRNVFLGSDHMKLEDIDDMEDRVSELEIKVNRLKIEEITVPGIKQAQIITEKLPLSYTQEMRGENNGVHKRSVDMRNEIGGATEKNSRKVSPSKSKENLEGDESSMCKTFKGIDGDLNLSCNRHILNESNYSDQRCSIVANASETGTANFSEQNDDTLTSSCDDHSEFSIHSIDFSFSCSCSTSISQSSIHHDIPNESLPFLILQNLSCNRKGYSNTRVSKSVQYRKSTADNIDSAIQCESDNEESCRKESSLKELRVNQLHRKVLIESTMMEQASKALSLCYSSNIFSGSPPLIEGERLLLLSTLRKQAILDEIRRLEAQKDILLQKTESIEIIIEKIRLHLMEDFLTKIATVKQQSDCYHFICIVSHKENVLSSEVILANPDQPSIEFQPKDFRLEGQFSDNLSLCFRIYALQVAKCGRERGRTKIFARKTWETKKEKTTGNSSCVCLSKASDSEAKLNSINEENKKQSIIRSPSFVLTARTELCLPKDLHKTSLQLEQYEPFCYNGNHFKILQDTASLNIACTFKTTRNDSTIDKYVSKDHQGFLTRFSIISGNGAWQREWWCLKGTFLLSWKYPEDEDYLPPIRVIDLKFSTDKISPVPRRQCARSNTFIIVQDKRSNIQDEEQDSTKMREEKKISSEHILSADTREEMDNWCKKLNAVLYLLQSWRIIPNFFQK